MSETTSTGGGVEPGGGVPTNRQAEGGSALPGASPFSGMVPPPEHRWKPGQSGNPTGRPKGSSILGPFLRRLARQPDGDGYGEEARALADKLYDSALDGDAKAVEAITKILDRTDGPVPKHLEHSGGLTQVILRGGEQQAAGEGDGGKAEAVEGF